MSVMATSRMLTRADLDALPEDGLRHELIDGALVMTPAPGFRHQRMSGALFKHLSSQTSGTGLLVLYAPFDVVLGHNVVEPDIIVAHESAFGEHELATAPVLAVEIRSPSTRWLDEGRKREIYEQFGVASYWLVDPVEPAVTVLELTDGKYAQIGMARGDQSLVVSAPVSMTLNPSVLARG